MSEKSIGELEEIVLLVVAIMDGDAYSVGIIKEIEERIGRKLSLGAIQTVLKRLEQKQLLSSEFGSTTNARGGKRKRLYEITTSGTELLFKIRAQRNSLWNDIPRFLFTT